MCTFDGSEVGWGVAAAGGIFDGRLYEQLITKIFLRRSSMRISSIGSASHRTMMEPFSFYYYYRWELRMSSFSDI